MNIVTKSISYQAQHVSCQGMLAFPQTLEKRPLVLVAHDWSGCNAFAIEKAKELAMLGYVGFAIDMYGDGRTGSSKEEKAAMMQPLMQDRELLLARIHAAYQAALAYKEVDATKIGGIGFCFGGLCILDLARSGVMLNGVVSFHGLLTAPQTHSSKQINAKVLVLHGYDDPMVTPDAVLSFAHEMNQRHADWQIHMYSNTMHAFTNPEANDVHFGTVYNPATKQRAWQSMRNFFDEVFA